MSQLHHTSRLGVLALAVLSATPVFSQTCNVNNQPCTLPSDASGYTAGPGTLTLGSGAITNNTSMQFLAGGGGNTTLGLQGDMSLNGSGTLTLSGNSSVTGAAAISSGNVAYTLTNSGNTINGYGWIVGDMALVNQSNGIVNANVTDSAGQYLLLNGGGGVTNTGLLTATNGGYLILQSAVNNSGGNITAATGTVEFFTPIQGGTLNGANLQAYVNSGTGTAAALDGATNGALTLSTGAVVAVTSGTNMGVLGTINNEGNIQVAAGTNSNSILGLNGNTTLQGGGTLTLASDSGSTGTAIVGSGVVASTLTNTNHTIQGYGFVGDGALLLSNSSTGAVNANSSGQALVLNGGGVTNAGLLTATNGGYLILQTTVNNAGGNITASTGTVEFFTPIQGGTLNGANLQAYTGNGTVASLDGASYGALTLWTGANLTVTSGTNMGVVGTINNEGNIQLAAGTNSNSILGLNGDTTLQGGGTLTLASDSGSTGTAIVTSGNSASTLTNTNHTIEGYGRVGDGALVVINGSGGTLLANAAGQTLVLNGGGGLTNNGTLQANAGSTLLVSSNLTNFSGSTLTGGTYNVYGTANATGNIQLSLAANTGGEIVNNAATILLNGANSEITDTNGNNALSAFAANLAAGSFSILGGQSFESEGAFGNAGLVDIGEGDVFTVASNAAYSQSGGITQVDGTLTATTVGIDGGTLKGSGEVDGNVTVDGGGIVAPGDSPGILTVDGNYDQASDGSLDIVLQGGIAGTGYSVLDVEGSLTLAGALNLTSLNNFIPTSGETFEIMNWGSGEESGKFTTANWANLAPGLDYSLIYNSTGLEVEIGSQSPSSTPEPSTWILLGSAFIGLGSFRLLKNKRVGARG